MKERIFSLRLDIKEPNIPFAVGKSIGVESGDLIEVFSRFQILLVRLLEELKKEELDELRNTDDDIPF